MLHEWRWVWLNINADVRRSHMAHPDLRSYYVPWEIWSSPDLDVIHYLTMAERGQGIQPVNFWLSGKVNMHTTINKTEWRWIWIHARTGRPMRSEKKPSGLSCLGEKAELVPPFVHAGPDGFIPKWLFGGKGVPYKDARATDNFKWLKVYTDKYRNNPDNMLLDVNYNDSQRGLFAEEFGEAHPIHLFDDRGKKHMLYTLCGMERIHEALTSQTMTQEAVDAIRADDYERGLYCETCVEKAEELMPEQEVGQFDIDDLFDEEEEEEFNIDDLFE